MTPMVVQCSSCLTEFELDPNKVPVDGVRARCSVCSAVITVPAPPAKATAPDSASGPSAPEAPALPHVEPTHVEPARSEPAYVEPVADEPTPTVVATAEPVAASAPPAWSTPEPLFAPPPPPPPSPPVPAAQSHAEPEGQRRSINPFLTRDPALRAKRLARALVSDIVAYHPARHAEGLRDGTLKTLFRDEIKKSYEEYVDQVGRDFAGSTTHFQDALNDVLASGKKLF